MQDNALFVDGLGPRRIVSGQGFDPDSLGKDDYLLCPCGRASLSFNQKAQDFSVQGGAHDVACRYGIVDEFGKRGAKIWDVLMGGQTIITKVKKDIVPKLRTGRQSLESKHFKKRLGKSRCYDGFTICSARDMRLLLDIKARYEQTYSGQKADIRCNVQGKLFDLDRLMVSTEKRQDRYVDQDNCIRAMMSDVMHRSSRPFPEAGLLPIKRTPYLFSIPVTEISASDIQGPSFEDVGLLKDLGDEMFDRLYASPVIQIGATGHSCYVYNHNAKTNRHLPFHGFQIVIHSQGNGAIDQFMNDAIKKSSPVEILSGFYERNMRAKVYAFQQTGNNQYARERLDNGARDGVLVLHLYPENTKQLSLGKSHNVVTSEPKNYPRKRHA